MVEDFERLCWIRWRAGGADKVALIRGLDPLAEHIQGVRADLDCWFGGNEEVGLVCVVHGFTAANERSDAIVRVNGSKKNSPCGVATRVPNLALRRLDGG